MAVVEEAPQLPSRNWMVWTSWGNVALGVVTLLTPLLLGESRAAAVWTSTLGGALVAVLAFHNAWVATTRPRNVTLAATANALVGIWLIVFPFTTTVGPQYQILTVLEGLLILLLASYNAFMSSRWGWTSRRPLRGEEKQGPSNP
jgi:phosphatidylserine synthase